MKFPMKIVLLTALIVVVAVAASAMLVGWSTSPSAVTTEQPTETARPTPTPVTVTIVQTITSPVTPTTVTLVETRTLVTPTTQVTTVVTTRELFSGVIDGAGASFLNPQMQAWASKFYEITNGRIKVNYQSIGSGAGQSKFKEGLLDFAGSDPPLRKAIYEEFKEKGGIVQFPVIIGTIVVVYNIPGVGDQQLRLTGEVIARIYLGEIMYWDDPRIKELNPGLNLPHEKIIAVHRSDGSGTTRILTAWLSKISKDWKEKVGSDFTVEWPVDKLGNGIGAKGNEGVAAAVQQNPYSIGYVETAYAYASGLSIAPIKNRDGKYVVPTEESVKEASKALVRVLPKAHEDWSSIFPDETVDPPGAKSYPLTAFSFVILKQEYDDHAKVEILKEFFEWVLTEGQKKENIVPGYDPLPPEVAQIGLEGLKLLKTR